MTSSPHTLPRSVSTIPFDIINYYVINTNHDATNPNNSTSSVVPLLRLIRLLRLFKIIKLVKGWRFWREWEAAFPINYGAVTLVNVRAVLSHPTRPHPT